MSGKKTSSARGSRKKASGGHSRVNPRGPLHVHHGHSGSSKTDGPVIEDMFGDKGGPLKTHTEQRSLPSGVHRTKDSRGTISENMLLWLWFERREKGQLKEIVETRKVKLDVAMAKTNQVTVTIASLDRANPRHETSVTLAVKDIKRLLEKHDKVILSNRDVSDCTAVKADEWITKEYSHEFTYLCKTPDKRQLLIGLESGLLNEVVKRMRTQTFSTPSKSRLTSAKKKQPIKVKTKVVHVSKLLWGYLCHTQRQEIGRIMSKHSFKERDISGSDDLELTIQPDDREAVTIRDNLEATILFYVGRVEYDEIITTTPNHNIIKILDATAEKQRDFYFVRDKNILSIVAPKGKMSLAKSTINDILTPSPRHSPTGRHHAHTKQTRTKMTFTLNKTTVLIYKADITKLKVDVIVNAANEFLCHNAGVARAIATAAGQDIQWDCDDRINEHGQLEVSETFVTRGYKLPCRYVIHVVGPMWRRYPHRGECGRFLRKAFTNCLEEAEDRGLTSIAIPAVSSGK